MRRSRQSSSDSTDLSDSDSSSPRKRVRSSSTTEREEIPIKVYIVQEKLDPKAIHDLFNLIEKPPTSKLNLQLCRTPEDANVIVTNIKMKKRLQRHVNWDVARQKSIVTPEWIYASIKKNSPVECKDYAALSELMGETAKYRSEGSQGQMIDTSLRLDTPTMEPTDPRVYQNWTSRYACARASPLTCPNQTLANELSILGKSRELEGKSVNALSYERSVAIIKSYPYVITEETYKRDVVKLPGLGSKTISKIRECLKHGYIPESRSTRLSERFQALSAFTTIYGIGPFKARTLYDQGLRTLEDMERYYDITPEHTLASLDASLFTPNGRRIPSTATGPTSGSDAVQLPDLSIQVSLLLRHEFEVPIPRDEAEEMERVVMRELGEIQPGCISTIVGGYRRGKVQGNDVDIIISHPDTKNGANIIKGLCKKLTRRLYDRGLVTHCMHLSGFHAHDALRNENWDSLEKALTVFKLPWSESSSRPGSDSPITGGEEHEPPERLHRRLDLIFAIPEAYWTAVVGWSGSRMFERDLRLWGKVERGMKFDSSGITRRHDSKLFVPRSEQEVFSILGLDWVDPTMRNADV